MRKLISLLCLSAFILTGVSFANESLSENVVLNSKKELYEPMGTYKYVILYNGVNVRTGPGTNYKSIGTVNKGDFLWSSNLPVPAQDGTNKAWLYVYGPPCGAGYIRTDMFAEDYNDAF